MDKQPQSSDSSSGDGPAALQVVRRRLTGRKLLVASIGVATVNYVTACAGVHDPAPTSGNLAPPGVVDQPSGVTNRPGIDAGGRDPFRNMLPPTSGNLMAAPPGPPTVRPPPGPDAGSDDAG